MVSENLNTEQILTVDPELIDGLREAHEGRSKFGSLTLLLVTVILFFSAEIISAEWQEVLILIGVILFHELGHFFAMKILRYDDVKMFFLPMIGAAVSGKAKRETALKSCVVSLMGPFPGILLGTVLFFLFSWTNNYFLLKATQVMLLLNAFNFLPIMPLDGGRFLDVLFVKRRVFRLIFALFGSVVFLALAAFAKDPFLGLIGVFAIVGAISSFKVHGMAKAIELQGFSAVSMEDLLEKPEQLTIAINVMKSRYTKLFEPKTIHKSIYTYLTVVVDTLKFIPAGILSKLSLLLAYPVLLLISIVVTFIFLAANFEERVSYAETESGKVTYAEKYMYGTLRSRIPINSSLRHDGTGVGFGRDTSIITDFYTYDDGYRTGTWVTRNETGDTIEKNVYNNGKLYIRIKKSGDLWDTVPSQKLPIFQKMVAKVREFSQPVRSNYKHFE